MRLLGYYKIKQGVLKQNLSKYYHFEKTDKACNELNKMVNVLKQEETKSKENYPWLDDSDERKYMTDKEISDKYISLDSSCITRSEKKEVIEMLYSYRDPFSLRDEIGTCPNIEVDIEVTDKASFFIRPYHAREEDRATLDKEMK